MIQNIKKKKKHILIYKQTNKDMKTRAIIAQDL
jgi:hypothetical protein